MNPMREAYILGFRFRFVGPSGKPNLILRNTGSVTRDGIFLAQQRIFFRDVHSVSTHNSKLIINLLPYATTTREICEYVFPKHNSIVIQVEELLADKIKSIIDQRCTGLVAKDKWGDLPKEERGKHYKYIGCPRCDSIIDLTELHESHYVHCKYCEAIFDRFGYILAGSEDYRICPECDYYGRVRDNLDFQFHGMGQKGFSSRTYHCCDTCAHRIFLKNVWKNMVLLVGFGVTVFQKLRSKRDRNPFYKELTEANLLAQNGDMVNADILFSSITFRNDGHPGLHHNYGKAYLANGDRDRAAFQFKKALEACSNYHPVLEILKRNVDLVPES